MYNPKDILTKSGYEEYCAHLHNIRAGLSYIENHSDDLHIGAIDGCQLDDWCAIYDNFEKLLPVLKTGDGEKDEVDGGVIHGKIYE